jgi:hypothetical protein
MSPPSSEASGPIFLAGVDRSGIGLLGEVLECHPAVSMTRRTNFWAFYAGRFGSLTSPAAVDRCLDEMMRNARMRVLEPDRARLRDDLARGAPTYERLFELLQLQLMERRGRTRWGDKSLGAERFARTILAAYPTAGMVHVLRDPRDRYASHDRHRQLRRSGAGRGAALWQWSERLARRNTREFPGRYLVVRYEDLVSDPDGCLASVQDLLGLDPPTETIESSPLTTASIGRHRRDLSAAERRYLQLVLGPGMRRWGYPAERVDLSVAATVSFWARTLPVNSTRALLWTATNAIHPHQQAPSARRLQRDEQGASSSGD